MVMAYDYTVLAGTQGAHNHAKTDRMLEHRRAPGACRSCCSPKAAAAGPATPRRAAASARRATRFGRFAELSGLVPLVGITSGRCFAGNASLLGCCDVDHRHARTRTSAWAARRWSRAAASACSRRRRSVRCRCSSPTASSTSLVADEAEAVAVAKQYLSYFQGPLTDVDRADQRRLRHIVPENRLRVYDVRDGHRDARRRRVGARAAARVRARHGHLADPHRGPPGRRRSPTTRQHLGGAIDSDGADKARAVHAALRRVRHPAAVSLRHARHHGRAGGREDGAGPALRAAVRDRREPDRAVLHDRAAQGLRPRRHRHGRRQLQARRSSTSPGRPASSAAWAWRAR